MKPLNLALGVAAAALLALLAPAALAAEGSTGVTYTREDKSSFQRQLAAKQIRSATINKRLRTVRLTLTDGRHVLVKYAKHQEPKTAAQLKAQGVPVTVLSQTEAEKEPRPKGTSGHKLRYIVGGVVILVIVLVGAVLLFRRRRSRD